LNFNELKCLDCQYNIVYNRDMDNNSSNSNKSDNKPLPTGMAFKYETAYNQLFDAEPAWMRSLMIEEPLGRHSTEVARMAAILAEKGEISAMQRNQGDMTFDPDYMLAPSGVVK
jgi:hypothetical protein